MQHITTYVDLLIQLMGLHGHTAIAARHILLVLAAIIVSSLAGIICHRVLMPLVLKITRRTSTKLDDVLLNERVLLAACRLVPAVVLWKLLPLCFYQYPSLRDLLGRLTAIYITVMSVKLSTTFISSLRPLLARASQSTQQYFHSFFGVMKIIMVFIGAIVIISILINKSPGTLIAGLGATSAVLMLVFQDTIKGLVAGIRLTSNNMLHKGDWITVPKAGADGTVEEMSLTTVKIRNFDNTIVTVTPQTLVDDSFKNWLGMQQSDGRRCSRKVYFDFRSIEPVGQRLGKLIEAGYVKKGEALEQDINLTLFRRYTESYLRGLDTVNDEMTVLVHQTEPTTTGLPVEFYFFLYDKDWEGYERKLGDIFEHIYATAPAFGLKIYQQEIKIEN